MPTTTIQLPPDVAASIQQKVESGHFPDAAEVMREAMHLLDEEERRLDEVRARLQSGLDQLDRGEGIPFAPEWSADRARIAMKRAAVGDKPHPDVCP
jgi:antitoxin ParD1/3/4